MNRFLPLAIFALVVIASIWGLVIREDRDALPSALIAKPAPEFELPRLLEENAMLSHADFSGDAPIILNFWASWCAPCRIENAELLTLKDMGYRVIGVNYKDKRENALRFLESLGNPFVAIGIDDTGRTAIDYGVAALPETFVISPGGQIVYKHVGPVNPGELEGKILPAIEAARSR